MKTSMLISLFILLVLAPFGCTNDSSKNGGQQASDTKEVYTCPMHPSVISDRPGACPVCGMALVKKSQQQELSGKDKAMLETVSLSPTQRVVANIATMRVERTTISGKISAVGVVDFAEPLQATVAARFRGRIEKLHVNFTGSVVRKGQPLFDLYSPDLISAQQDFLLTLDAKKSAEAMKNESNAAVQDRLIETSRNRLHMHFGLTNEQITELEQDKKMRHTATYYSPISGTVLSKQIQEGQFVDEGSTLYQLADLSRVWIYLDVYEKDLRNVHIGQRVGISTEAYAGDSFTGRVTFIDPTINAESRTVRVRTEFTNAGGKLKPNMFVKATIEQPNKDAIVVPASALISTGKRNVVWVEVGENSFVPRNVVIGAKNESSVEILSGIEEGEKIVTTGGYLIDSESQLSMPAMESTQHEHAKMGSDVGDRESGIRDRVSEEDAPDASRQPPIANQIREIKVHVEHAYSPEVIKLKKGEKVRLLFYRNEESRCTDEVIFKDFGIKKKLPAFKTTAIEFTPKKVGSFDFSCGMEMVYGKLVVE